jgi:ribosomal protein L7/L12
MVGNCRKCGRFDPGLFQGMVCGFCLEERNRQIAEDERRHEELLEALKTPAQRRAEAREQKRREAEYDQMKYERFRLYKIKIQDVRVSDFARERVASKAINKIRAGEEIYIAGTYCISLDYTQEVHANKLRYSYWFGDKKARGLLKMGLERVLNSDKEIPNLLANVANGDVFFKLEISSKEELDAFKIVCYNLEDIWSIYCVSEVWLKHIIRCEPQVSAVASVSPRPSESIQPPPHETVGASNPAGNNFSIFLQGDVDADRKISIIGVIRRITKMGLADAKNLVEQEGMRLIQRNLSKQEADEMKQKIEAVGGSVIVSTGTTN